MILAYSCRLAILSGTLPNGCKIHKKVWLVADLPHDIGQLSYGQLPGAILKLDFNEGEQIFEATKMEFRKVKKKEIKPPGQGKKPTKGEYQAMFE